MGGLNCVNGKCLIEGGTFTMGSPRGVGGDDEHPQKSVTVTTFKIGQTEVSLGDYKRYLAQQTGAQLKAVLSGCASGDATRTIPGKAGETLNQLRGRAAQVYVAEQCRKLETEQVVSEGLPMEGYCGETNGKGDEYPVTCLTMKEKKDYCEAQGGRLMTAAEFHYAARNDEQDAGADRLVIWDNRGKYGGSTVPVTSGYKNRDGVYNLLGNVWESLADAYEKDFYARMPGTDPYNPLTNPYDYQTNPQGQLEELGGGSFDDVARNARAANRDHDDPDDRIFNVGIRCVWPQDSE